MSTGEKLFDWGITAACLALYTTCVIETVRREDWFIAVFAALALLIWIFWQVGKQRFNG